MDAAPFVARRPGQPERRAVHPEFGALAGYLADPAVTDVFVNGPHEVWVDRGGGAERQPAPELDETAVRELAVRLVALGGRHIDEASPCVDTRLHDGIRVHAVLPPVSPGGTLLSIRVPRAAPWGLAELDAAGFFELVPSRWSNSSWPPAPTCCSPAPRAAARRRCSRRCSGPRCRQTA